MSNQVPSVEIEQLPHGVRMLDVREQDEWDAGHAPDAVHVPIGEITNRLDELPDDDPVYVVCQLGGRSAQVTAYLNANGRSASNVLGGMKAWHAAGRPLVGETPGTDPFVL